MESRNEWEGLKAIGMAVSRCTQKGKTTEETRYFIASITNGTEFANAVRAHWGIESMHWTLDVTFNEDRSRIRKENGPENTALLRKMALNILKIEKAKDEKQQSYKAKRFIASMDEDYLEKVMIENIQNL